MRQIRWTYEGEPIYIWENFSKIDADSFFEPESFGGICHYECEFCGTTSKESHVRCGFIVINGEKIRSVNICDDCFSNRIKKFVANYLKREQADKEVLSYSLNKNMIFSSMYEKDRFVNNWFKSNYRRYWLKQEYPNIKLIENTFSEQIEIPICELKDIFIESQTFYLDIPTYLFHATYKPLLMNIKKQGLGGKSSKPKWEDSKVGVVYLATDPNIAESYAESSEIVCDDWLDDIVVLKIYTGNLDQSKFDIDHNVLNSNGDTLEYHGIIPFSEIEII